MTVEDIVNVQTLDDLMEVSFCIEYGVSIRVCWPKAGRVRNLELHNVKEVEDHYYVNNSVMIYRTSQAAFVIPYLKQFEDILSKNGFKKKSMHVPFSNLDYPEELQAQWEQLVQTVSRVRNNLLS